MDVGEMQKPLSQGAAEKPTDRRRALYSLRCHATWLRAAVAHVQTNKGRATAGRDRVTRSHLLADLDGTLLRRREARKAKTFAPKPVWRQARPKANGSGPWRPLGLPPLLDRSVPAALRLLLEPLGEADVSMQSYGCRPKRSTDNAIGSLRSRLPGRSGAGSQWLSEGDITSYFDTIPHRRLSKAVPKRGADRHLLALLWKFLRAGVRERGVHPETLTGTPQGGLGSPLRANRY